MEYFKISFGSGKALNYVEYGRDKKNLLWRLSDWRRGKGRGARNKSKEIHGHFGVKTLRRGMMWCKWGGSIDPSGWCLQKGRPSAIAISLEGSVEKYKAFIITLLVSFRFTTLVKRWKVCHWNLKFASHLTIFSWPPMSSSTNKNK